MDCPYTGKGEEFTPGKLVGTALAGGMCLSLGTVAQRNKLDVTGACADIELSMTEQPNVFSEPELEAAKATGETFAKLFRGKEEDSFGLLLVPREALSRTLSPLQSLRRGAICCE